VSGQDIEINGPDGTFGGYLATPDTGKGPGIVVIQEIFGVNKVMRDICDGLAREGFVALCPDLFWRLEPGIQLTDQSEEEWAKAFELFNAFDVDTGIVDVDATIEHLRQMEACNNKVGAVGYCLGGLLAYLTAARTDADASVGFYGVNIQEKLDESDHIKKPVMLHVAEKDEFVPAEAQAAIKEGLAGNDNVTVHSYAGRDHAFAREGGAHYHKDDADLANGRTLAFFRQHLK